MKNPSSKTWPTWIASVLLAFCVGFFLWLSGSHSSAQPFKSPLLKVQSLAVRTGVPYRFIAFGDWGAGTQFQKDVAAQTIALYEKKPFSDALLLGDNIYEDGDVKKHGKSYFTDMYAPLINGVRFIVALGNHDERGGFQSDQIRFFDMPGSYYVKKSPCLDYFVINSNHFAKDAVQQKWLDKALAASRAQWKIVLGHHPVFSSGEHGNTPGLIQTLKPLLEQHGVDMYLAGHDHDYERFAPINGVQYIVSGGGGAYLRDFAKPVAHSLVRKKAHHFLSFELRGDTLSLQVIDKTGQIIDTYHWQKAARTQKLPDAS